jgi:hypothetical protein
LATKGGLDQDGINNMVQIAKADPQRAIAAFKELTGIPPTVK